jgi:hypothetical protein
MVPLPARWEREMQKYGWILGVLTDVSTFAEKNGLHSLKRHIDDTRRVAEKEILSSAECIELQEIDQANSL